jgi:hypothetical protein
MGTPKLMSERELQKNVIDYARKLGYTLIYHTWNSIHSPSGFPDLVLCRPSDKRIIYIELKSEKGHLTKWNPMRPNWTSQEEWIEGLEACGQEVYVFRPSDLDSDRIINILQYKNPGKQGS